MNVLWITNIPIGDIVDYKKKPMGGLWMDALLKKLRSEEDYRFIVVTSGPNSSISYKELNGISYYLLPGGNPVNYRRNRKDARQDWYYIFDKEKPDVIQVWGTEYSHALVCLEEAKKRKIPSVIYIQGVMTSIYKYATAGLPASVLYRYISLRDIFRGQALTPKKRWFKKCADVEKKLISLSGSIIVENMWAEAYYKSINPTLHVFNAPLTINEVFYETRWNLSSMIPHTILCNASGPAYKGLHMLLFALRIIKQQYPDVKLFIPGGSMNVCGIERQKKPGYYSYITDYIKKNDLTDNIVFTGYLNQQQLAKKLSEVNVFVLPSAIENHSSSLKEALAVGTPSVASMVGGIPEYLEFGKNGYSYRYEDYECLADYVIKLFSDDVLCEQFSKNSVKSSLKYREFDDKKAFKKMYHALVEDNRL